jgi:hypothetical protein
MEKQYDEIENREKTEKETEELELHLCIELYI